jgi:hypothetical protein
VNNADPTQREPDDTMTEEPEITKPDDWQLWPPSPKVQIILVAAVFGLINLCLLGIWAYVMIDRFG